MEKIRVFKRYQNRKLYDVELSQYATLGDLDFYIQEGIEVRVVDNVTKRDITSQVLAQVIVGIQNTYSRYSVNQLSEFIKQKGEIDEFSFTS